MRNRLKPLLPLAATALLGACASQQGFPSLAPRPVEWELAGKPPPPCHSAPTATPAPAAAAIADDPALATRVTELLGEARRGERAFSALLGPAQASARRATGVGSEAWIEAQEGVSRLEAVRAPTVDALAELEALSLARANSATSEADRERLLAAAADVRRLADAQREQLDRLSRALSAP